MGEIISLRPQQYNGIADLHKQDFNISMVIFGPLKPLFAKIGNQ